MNQDDTEAAVDLLTNDVRLLLDHYLDECADLDAVDTDDLAEQIARTALRHRTT